MIDLDVERSSGEWTNARQIFASIIFKFKLGVDNTDHKNIEFMAQPLDLELSKL